MRRLRRRQVIAGAAAVAAATALGACEAFTGPRAATGRKLTVMHLADIHGKLRPHPELLYRAPNDASESLVMTGGMPAVAALAKKIRAEKERTAFVYSGDTFHSSGIAVISSGQGLVPAINALGLDAYCPGNWDWAAIPAIVNPPAKPKTTYDTFRDVAAQLTCPVVGYNAHPAGSPPGTPIPHPTKTGEPLLRPYVLKEIQGLKVGIIGMTAVMIKKEMAPAISTGVEWEQLDTAPVKINAFAKELRDQGAQLVFLLSELGLNQEVQLARSLNGVDVIFGAHTHERTYKPIVSGSVLVVQSGSEASFLGQMDIVVGAKGGIASHEWKLHELVEGYIAPDPEMAKLIDATYAKFPQLAEVVGRTTTPIMRNSVLETSMDNLIADAVQWKTKADFAVSRGFRYAHPIPAGPITLDDVFSWFPVNPPLRTGKVTTRQILTRWEDMLNRLFSTDAFEQSGGWVDRPSAQFKAVIQSKGKSGERVESLEIGGKRIYERGKGILHDGPWTIAACAREGDPPDSICYIPKVAEPKTLPARGRTTIIEYLKEKSPVSPRIEGRVIATDLDKVIRSLFKG